MKFRSLIWIGMLANDKCAPRSESLLPKLNDLVENEGDEHARLYPKRSMD